MPAPEPPVDAPPAPRPYLRATRSATFGFLAALPLLLLYEGLLLFAQGGAVTVRVGADVWLKYLLSAVGASGFLALTAVTLLVGLVILYLERGRPSHLRAQYFGWMLAESAVYAVVLAVLVSGFVGFVFAMAVQAAPGAAPVSVWTRLALSIGAGVYEELVFRVLLVGGLFWLLRRLLPRTTWAYPIAAVVGALIFSWVHYTGALGDPFAWPSFTFRFLFGLALNVVFLVRGFAVAAWTHALYDVFLVVGLLGR